METTATADDLDEVSPAMDRYLVDPASRDNPYGMFARLRELDPVHQSSGGAWVFTRYQDVNEVLRDARWSRWESARHEYGEPPLEDELVARGVEVTRQMPDLLAGWSPGRPPWLEAYLAAPRDPHGPRLYTAMGGYALAGALTTGRAECIPVRLSAMGRLLAQLRPSLAVIPGVRRGRGFALRAGIGWHLSAARHAAAVVVEVDPTASDIGLPEIPGSIVDVREVTATADAYTPPEPGPAELQIARTVAALLPDEPTLQFGPGAITSAILAAIDRPVRIASGLATAAIADLAERNLLRGQAVASYDWGGAATERLALEGRLSFVPIEESNDPGRIAAIIRFVALNTALQVDLEGSVNVERLGGRTIAGSGGHADFCSGASRSRDGLSVIALRSTGRKGVSAIVPQVEVVSTPRTDVDVIVTEHGVADLRGCGSAERTRRIIRIADPSQRDWLSRQT